MTRSLLLCTDLDRTLLPNGKEPESPEARARFRDLVARPGITLAFVTGRDRELVREAIEEYDLPQPDYVVGDVGTSIYQLTAGHWHPLTEWEDEIGRDWAGAGHAQLAALFADMPGLRLQEPARQGPFKLSYHAPADTDAAALRARLRERLDARGIRANLVWSIDEEQQTGLLDVLPANADKLHAVRFLMARLGHDLDSTLFAGDSGNDLPVLISPIPSVLVANGHPKVRAEARRSVADSGHADSLYCAHGDWLGMNGNYSAGILEGIAHFHPELGEPVTAS